MSQKKKRQAKDDDDDSDTKSEKPVVHSFEILRDEAEHFLHVKKFKKATQAFTKALEYKADDPHALISRAKCYLNLGEFDKALADADKSLEIYPYYPPGLLEKAEILYVQGNFETALVFFHRGRILRPENHVFSLGVNKCEEAILNAVGDPKIARLSKETDLTLFYQGTDSSVEKFEYKRQVKEEEVVKPIERNKTDQNNCTVKKLLGKIYADREFLEKILRDDGKYKHKGKGDPIIRDATVECLNYLDMRSEFWQQQKPLYARKKQLKEPFKQAGGESTEDSTMFVIKSMDEIDDKQEKGEHTAALRQARRLLRFVEMRSEQDLQNKQEVMSNLYSFIGNSLLEQGKLDQAMQCHQKDLDIGKRCDNQDAVSRATDNIGRVYALRGEYKRAIEVWERKIPKIQTHLEASWLYHEIGRCYLELRHCKKARNYALLSLNSAKENQDESWQLSANVLLAQVEIRSQNFHEALEHFEVAREIAKKLEFHNAEQGLNTAIEKVRGTMESISGNVDSENKKM